MWTYNYTDELYHYGVPGMKWGVRRAQRRAARADRTIRRLETHKKNNRNIYENNDADAREIYVGRKAKRLKTALARNKAEYDTSEVTNNYLIARQKAKKDSTYKKSNEYITAKKAYNKQTTQMYVYGPAGHQRIETLKNTGMSERKAKGRVLAGQILGGLVVGGASLGTAYLTTRL